MQGLGVGNESLSSLVEPRDGGGPEGAIIRNEEMGQKTLSIRNSQRGLPEKWKSGEPYYDFEGKAGEAPVQRQAP